jgi:hypothetical protein
MKFKEIDQEIDRIEEIDTGKKGFRANAICRTGSKTTMKNIPLQSGG